MTIKSAVRTASLLAVVLLSVPAFAGTATYLGTHTAANVQIPAAGLAGGQGGATVTYTGGNIEITGDGAAFDRIPLPDGSGGRVDFFDDDFTWEFTIESVTGVGEIAVGSLPGAYVQFDGTNGGGDGVQPIDVWVYTVDNGGTPTLVGTDQLFNQPTIAGSSTSAVTYPVTVTIVGSGTTATVTAEDATMTTLNLGTFTLEDGNDYYPSIFINGLLDGSTPNSVTIAFSSIVVTGPNVPDINVPPPPPVPNATITRDAAIDDAFVSGSGTWSVEFDEDVQFVDDADFEILDSGDAEHTTGPTVTANSASSYTVAVGGVTGAAGGVSLTFLGPGTSDGSPVESISSGELAPAVNGPQYTNLPLPAATNWVLVLLALTLAFAAAVVIRRRALKQ